MPCRQYTDAVWRRGAGQASARPRGSPWSMKTDVVVVVLLGFKDPPSPVYSAVRSASSTTDGLGTGKEKCTSCELCSSTERCKSSPVRA